MRRAPRSLPSRKYPQVPSLVIFSSPSSPGTGVLSKGKGVGRGKQGGGGTPEGERGRTVMRREEEGGMEIFI